MNQTKGFIVSRNGNLKEVNGDSYPFQEDEMSIQEKEMLMMIVEKDNVPLDERWQKESKCIEGRDGVTYVDVTEFARNNGLIADYLKAAYPFEPVPKLDDELFDIHSGKTFKVRDCKFILYAGRVMAVSPEFYKSGGTVLDWVEPERVDGKGRIVAMQEVRKEA